MLGGEPFDVIGVMPRGLRRRSSTGATEVWAPPCSSRSSTDDDHRTNEFLGAVGRLKPGISLEQATRDVTAFADGLKRDHPGLVPTTSGRSRRGPSIEYATAQVRPALLVLLGAVGFVLLIACANIANLLLARSAARTREMAVRAAIGATRRDLIRQLLTESVLLSLARCRGGTAASRTGAIRALIALAPIGSAADDADPHRRQRCCCYTLGIALATGLLFGFAPALQASRADLQHALKDGARTAGERTASGFAAGSSSRRWRSR